jgi:hypothetical protein
MAKILDAHASLKMTAPPLPSSHRKQTCPYAVCGLSIDAKPHFSSPLSSCSTLLALLLTFHSAPLAMLLTPVPLTSRSGDERPTSSHHVHLSSLSQSHPQTTELRTASEPMPSSPPTAEHLTGANCPRQRTAPPSPL